MLRTFIIHDHPNKQGFECYTVKTDNGKPYLDNDPTITTSNELRLVERLIQWIREGKQ
jgi:hypothetical protein